MPEPTPEPEPEPAPEPEPTPEPTPEPEPVPEPTLQLSIDASEVGVGDAVQLTWQTSDVDSCSASGDWSGDKVVNGSHTFNVERYSTYALSCSNQVGTVTQMVSVAVKNLSVTWQAPTENVDGTALTDLAGFRLYRTSGTDYILEAEIAEPAARSIALAKPSGVYEFVMTAYDGDGNESAYSNPVTKTSP